VCRGCGQQEFSGKPIKIETQQVAQLVERLIEIVEDQKYTCICSQCGETQAADWSAEIVPGQDIGIRRQAFLITGIYPTKNNKNCYGNWEK